MVCVRWFSSTKYHFLPSPRTTAKFLVSILSTDKLKRIDQITLIRLWIKCSTLSTSSNEDLNQLTRIVIKLPEFRILCNLPDQEILEAKEPLSVFFAACGNAHDSSTDAAVRRKISDHLQAAIMGFEKWIPISETPPAIMKIHIVIGLIIFHCSPIVYIRVSIRSPPSAYQSIQFIHLLIHSPSHRVSSMSSWTITFCRFRCWWENNRNHFPYKVFTKCGI